MHTTTHLLIWLTIGIHLTTTSPTSLNTTHLPTLRFVSPLNDDLVTTGNTYTIEIAVNDPNTNRPLSNLQSLEYGVQVYLFAQKTHYNFPISQGKSRFNLTISEPGSYFISGLLTLRRMQYTMPSTTAAEEFVLLQETEKILHFEAVPTPHNATTSTTTNPTIDNSNKVLWSDFQLNRYLKSIQEDKQQRDHEKTRQKERGRPISIIHISDTSLVMGGYKSHLLQLLTRLPRGLYKQSIVDLSCTPPLGIPASSFHSHLVEWQIPIIQECIHVPNLAMGGWNTIEDWLGALRQLDAIHRIQDIPDIINSTLNNVIQILNTVDIMVLTNTDADRNSYLISLGRLTNTKVVYDLGPNGPNKIPWTVHGLSVFVAQSTYVSTHPNIEKIPIPVVTLAPIIDTTTFSYPSALHLCQSSGSGGSSFNNTHQMQKHATNKKNITVAFVGRLVTLKSVGFFIHAMKFIATHPFSKRLNVKFAIVGTGALDARLKALAKRLNLDSVALEWRGWLEHSALKCFLVNEVDIYVHTSMYPETFGAALAEAMLMRRAIVGYALGGPRDFLLNNKTGVVVQEHTPTALGQAILKLADDSEKRKMLGLAASDFVESQFSGQGILNKYSALYELLMVR